MFADSFDGMHWPDSHSPSNAGDKVGKVPPPDLDFGDGFGAFIDDADFTFPDEDPPALSDVRGSSSKRSRGSFDHGFDAHGDGGVEHFGASFSHKLGNNAAESGGALLRKPSLEGGETGLLPLDDFALVFHNRDGARHGGGGGGGDGDDDQHIVDDSSDDGSDGVVSEDSNDYDEGEWRDDHDAMAIGGDFLASGSGGARRGPKAGSLAGSKAPASSRSNSLKSSASNYKDSATTLRVGGKQLKLKLGGDLSMASTLQHMGLGTYPLDGSDAHHFGDDDGEPAAPPSSSSAANASSSSSSAGGAGRGGGGGASSSSSGRPTRKRRKTAKSEGAASDKSETVRLRNREHARSTRRRKKMYVECLKQQVAELLVKQQQIESGVLDGSEAADDAQSEEITIRKTIIVTFLQYRTSNVVDKARWADLVDKSFSMVQPRTPFRALPAGGEIVGNNRRSKGVQAAVDDATSIAGMLAMIRSRIKAQKPDTPRKKLNAISLSFDVDASDILVVGEKLMCHWNACTTGLVKCGFARECTIDGMLKCSFNDKHKLVDMELSYDVMAMTRQLQNYGLMDLSVLNFRSSQAASQLGLKHPLAAAGACAGSGGKPSSIASKLPLPSLAAMPPFRVPLMKSGSGGLFAPNLGGGLAAKAGSGSGDSSKQDGASAGAGGGGDMMSQMMMMNMLSMGGMPMPGVVPGMPMPPPLLNPASLLGGLMNPLLSKSSPSWPTSSSGKAATATTANTNAGETAATKKEAAAAAAAAKVVPSSPSKSSEAAAVAAANAAAAAAAAAAVSKTVSKAAASKATPAPEKKAAAAPPGSSSAAMSAMPNEQLQQMLQMSMMGPMITPAMFPIMSPAMFAAASTAAAEAAKKATKT